MSPFPSSCWLCLLLTCVISGASWAHKPSDSYLKITAGPQPLSVQWEIAVRDLEFLVGLDTDQDGQITWGELKSQRQVVGRRALRGLQVSADGNPIDLRLDDLLVARHSDGCYAVLKLTTDAPVATKTVATKTVATKTVATKTVATKTVDVEYSFLFEADPTHRGLVLLDGGASVGTYVLSPRSPRVQMRVGDANLAIALLDYCRVGVWHIWIGLDHILFLLCLLLPVVLVETIGPQPQEFRAVCWSVLKTITVFTVAHSITLWLAVMDYVELPSQWVEATIALSIIVTALNNLFPVLPLSARGIAFVFGLVHGFGFANVLTDLGLRSATLGVSLFGFNVGVELGQIMIVLVFLPLAFCVRHSWFYREVIFRWGSVAVAGIAGLWVYERVLDVQVFGF